jgi:lincosamide nucleotidyltransferase A/C/D/E
MHEIPLTNVVNLLRLFEAADLEVWLDGGWAVDALLCEQTRAHRDLDIILRASDLGRLREILSACGFTALDRSTAANVVFRNPEGHEIDAHAVTFDADGNGAFPIENASPWAFPASAFEGRGSVGGIAVRCMTPEAQVMCHDQGYEPAEKDCIDMEHLRARFGVELAERLRRAK